jgi:hypothetical protein
VMAASRDSIENYSPSWRGGVTNAHPLHWVGLGIRLAA